MHAKLPEYYIFSGDLHDPHCGHCRCIRYTL